MTDQTLKPGQAPAIPDAAFCYRAVEPSLAACVQGLTRLSLSPAERSKLLFLVLKFHFGAALAARQMELGLSLDAPDPVVTRKLADELVNDCILRPFIVGGRT